MDWTWMEAFFLVAARTTSFLVAAPFWGQRGFPVLARVGLGAGLALLVFPTLPAPPPSPGGPALALAAASEALTGLALGFLASLVFQALRTAGQLVDLEIGFAMVSLMDPESGGRDSALGQYFHLLGLVVFLSMDGHHAVIRALVDSFRAIPPGGGAWEGPLAGLAVDALATMFALAFRLALPFLGVLVVSDVALALVARTVPQLNVFMLSFPLKVAAGVALLSLTAPLFASLVGLVAQEMQRDLAVLLRVMSP